MRALVVWVALLVALGAMAACGGDEEAAQPAGTTPATVADTATSAAEPPATEAPPSEVEPTEPATTEEPADTSGVTSVPLTSGGIAYLEPGDYTIEAFAPAFTFTVAEPARAAAAPPGEMDLWLGADANVLLSFWNDSAVLLDADVEQTQETVTPDDVPKTADALVEWLQSHPRLTASPPTSATIGGVTGTEIVVEAKDGSGYQSNLCGEADCVPLFHAAEDPGSEKVAYYLEPGSKLRVDILEVNGALLFVMTEVIGDFDELVPTADSVLATVAFAS